MNVCVLESAWARLHRHVHVGGHIKRSFLTTKQQNPWKKAKMRLPPQGWEEDNVLTRDYTLHCQRGDIISLYEDYKIAKEIHDTLKEK
jgi:hypothetical protein